MVAIENGHHQRCHAATTRHHMRRIGRDQRIDELSHLTLAQAPQEQRQMSHGRQLPNLYRHNAPPCQVEEEDSSERQIEVSQSGAGKNIAPRQLASGYAWVSLLDSELLKNTVQWGSDP